MRRILIRSVLRQKIFAPKNSTPDDYKLRNLKLGRRIWQNETILYFDCSSGFVRSTEDAQCAMDVLVALATVRTRSGTR
jgi:hypothetical protein